MQKAKYKLAQHLNGHMLAAVDIETTGRLAGYHEIIQIAVVPLDSECAPIQGILPFYTNIAPNYIERAETKSTIIHGLVLKDLVKEALNQTRAADLFCEWFDDLNLPINKRLIPLAHNWAFEAGFLKNWLGLETMDVIWQGTARDTMIYVNYINDWAAMRGAPPPFNHASLPDICTKLKIRTPGKSHDALNDALATAKLYPILLANYPVA